MSSFMKLLNLGFISRAELFSNHFWVHLTEAGHFVVSECYDILYKDLV